MLLFKEYNPDSKYNCVVRSLSKLLLKDIKLIEKELIDLSKVMHQDNYTDISVFEKYMESNNIVKIKKLSEDIKIRDIDFSNGSYIVFCWDKKDFYHLVTIINNIVYDKQIDSLDLYVISVYKKNF